MDLHDKVIVITGAARGIGEAMARRFARERPAGLVVSDIDAEALEEVASDIGAFPVVADVSKEQDTVALIDAAEERFGPLDLFCANAGIGIGADEQTPDDEWQRLWEVNAMSHAYAARRLVPDWLARPRLRLGRCRHRRRRGDPRRRGGTALGSERDASRLRRPLARAGMARPGRGLFPADGLCRRAVDQPEGRPVLGHQPRRPG